MKQVYVVLGMARSGTSAVARGLKALGVDLGEKLVPANDKWNAKGFWEDADIVYKVNRAALYALDHPWMSTIQIDSLDAKKNALGDLKRSAVSLLKKRMVNTEHWGFKDPRTAKLMPFWLEVFQALEVQDQYVIVLRNPLSSAYSYQKLSGCDLEEALLLWLVHLISAVDGSRDKPRVVVSYDLLMQSPEEQLYRMKRALAIPDLADSNEIKLYIDEFLDKSLHHHHFNEFDLSSHPAVAAVPLCVRVHQVLMRLAKDEIRFDDEAFSAEWRSIKEAFEKISPVYQYINHLIVRNKQLERRIRTTHKSILWKMLYPLRIIDDAFRARRHKLREQRRLQRIYE